jgi:hypothetical protein
MMKAFVFFALGCVLVCGGLHDLHVQAAATIAKPDDLESSQAQVEASAAEDTAPSVNAEASALAARVKSEERGQQPLPTNLRREFNNFLKGRMANQNSYANNSMEFSPNCNWRFIFSPMPNVCDCHGSYPTTLMANDCQALTGYTIRDGHKIPFSSISANLHGRGYGVAYFWADNACHQMADSLTLNDNTGAAFKLWTTDGYYRQSCYCCGDGGPCRC